MGEAPPSQSALPRAIVIRGARTHNLRDVSLEIPRERLVVITGLSGSGKSSLAFDTIHAEGQRRFVESLSTYARQLLGPIGKPDVDHVSGLPPTLAIGQQTTRANPRSTVATATELHEYFRLLFARVGEPYCPRCGRPVDRHTTAQMAQRILSRPAGTRLVLLAPLVRSEKGEHKELLRRLERQGIVRIRLDGSLHEIREAPTPAKTKSHDVEAVVDRLVIAPDIRARLTESIDTALRLCDGLLVASFERADGTWEDEIFSQRYACARCDVRLPELEPRLFSFNSPHGACPECGGLGVKLEFDEALIVPDPSRSLEDGAIAAWPKPKPGREGPYGRALGAFCRHFRLSPTTPFRSIPAPVRHVLLHGTGGESATRDRFSFEGVIPNLERRLKGGPGEALRQRLGAFMRENPCKACGGARLRPESLAVRFAGRNIDELSRLSIFAAKKWFETADVEERLRPIGEPILRQIRQRLTFLLDVGLGYLSLNRTLYTLSGGEAQRLRLATQLGGGLVGVCYVLDEPTAGLHARETADLLAILRRLTAMGNSVIVVEHDAQVIASADWVVDVGPGAGSAGGKILHNGPCATLRECRDSVTAEYLRGDRRIELRDRHRTAKEDHALRIEGAAENNLKQIDVTIPLGLFCCVSGVSGSGKSTLVNQVLLPALRHRLGGSREPQGRFGKITGVEHLTGVVEVDQSPLGRSTRSNPATYTGVFDLLRGLLAATREAKVRGYGPERFSFNVKGGRCEACRGQGTMRIEMHFLPDLYVECAECGGSRYNPETLEVRYRGKNIADMLAMRVEEARPFFHNVERISNRLSALDQVGLGYLTLGQPAATLSGGEAQRVKLAAHLSQTGPGHRLYVLDEPTAGLHFADIHRLVEVLHRLCDQGHSLLVIEHNLDVIRQADWIIDLGPEGGEAGGHLVVAGPPSVVAKCHASHTGHCLQN